MIKVWIPEGDKALKIRAGALVEALRPSFKRMRCTDHPLVHSVVTVEEDPKWRGRLQLVFACCCGSFERRIKEAIDKLD